MPPTTIPDLVLEKFQVAVGLVREAQIRADAQAKATHARFNIFTTLLKEHDEVRLHTRFIHCLLDPKGSHDCGTLFLNLFFQTLSEMPGTDHEGEKTVLTGLITGDGWEVGKEVAVPPHGQIDLLLQKTGRVIAIENKINAGEGQRQLAGYADYLRGKSKVGTHLLFLTKDGKKAETHRGAYIRISYGEHILQWLDKCLRETYDVIPVNQGIRQYRDVVRQITGKNLSNSDMKAVAEYILKNPDIICYQKQFEEAIKEARATWFDRLAGAFEQELNKHGCQVQLRDGLVANRFGADPYGGLLVTPPNTSCLFEAPFKVCVENDTAQKVLCVGIRIDFDKQKPTAEEHRLFEKMESLLEKDATERGYQKGKKNDYWPTGWRNIVEGISDEKLAELMKGSLDSLVGEACVKTLEHIKLLERTYKAAKAQSSAAKL